MTIATPDRRQSTGDPAIDRLLDSHVPPPLSAGFADGVMARLAARQAGSPAAGLRRDSRARQIWRRSSRAIVGTVLAGLMTATAAAAAGVFGDIGVTIPAWQRTVERVTGLELTDAGSARPSPQIVPPAAIAEAAPAGKPTLREIVADGKISSRAELEAAGEAIDARRAARRDERRARIEAQVAAHLERRRAQGLSVPSADEQAAIRERIEARLTERDATVAERRTRFRETLGARIDAGEEIELRRPSPAVPSRDDEATDGVQPPFRWRDMTPAQRQEWRRDWRDRAATPVAAPSLADER